jgi:glycolate oxidase
MPQSLADALARRLSGGSVTTDPQITGGYARDSSPGGPLETDFTLVRARDRADVVDVLTEAAARGVPVVPQGARTGLAGGSSATRGAIVLNVEALSAIVEIDPTQGLAVVGPGVVTADLKTAALDVGLAYPPDPASARMCTIGGNIATNAGGLCCVKYGVTADYVMSTELVLPGGQIMRTGHRTLKGVAGYDLTGLVVGSEGTLGVVTEAVLRLVPAPDPARTAVGVFATTAHACAAIVALRRERHRPSLLELLDRPSIAAISALADYGLPDAEVILLVQSDRSDHARTDVYRYADVLAASGATEVAVADTTAESDALLAGRRSLNSAYEHKGSRLAEDICVPVVALPAFLDAGARIARSRGVEITMAGHGGDGNLHPSLFYDPGEPASFERAVAAFDELVAAAHRLGGTVTGEHGVGTFKARHLLTELGAAEVARQRAVKAVFDPTGIMNPGKVFYDPASGAAYH